MSENIIIDQYHNSFSKRLFDLLGVAVGLIFTIPCFVIISCFLLLRNDGPIIFVQKRVGKYGKPFNLTKFRTMTAGAKNKLQNLRKLNEADGPVFKIFDDPRYTRLGKYLAHTGLDELPQLINVLKGEMSIVGPRPLPIYEAKKLTKSQKIRELVKPGITSSWVVSGSHRLTFKKWMELDKDYVENANLLTDMTILAKTVFIMSKQIVKQCFSLYNF